MIESQQRYADLSAAGRILWKAVVALIAEETAFGPATQKVNRALNYIRTQQGHILDGKTEDGAEIVDNETLVYYAEEHSPAVLSIRLADLRGEEPGVIDEVLPHIQRGEVCFVGGGASPLVAVWMDTTGDGNDITTAARAFAIARGEVSR